MPHARGISAGSLRRKKGYIGNERASTHRIMRTLYSLRPIFTQKGKKPLLLLNERFTHYLEPAPCPTPEERCLPLAPINIIKY